MEANLTYPSGHSAPSRFRGKRLLRSLPDTLSYKLVRYGLRAYPLLMKWRAKPPRALRTPAFGQTFPSPLGIAAGFDKDGTFTNALFGRQASFVEIGTATPRAQKGNPAPTIRVLEEEQACLNSMGFPSEGIDKVIKRLPRYRGIVAINIGANRDSPNRINDYALCIEKLNAAKVQPTYVALNISSPNTEGLRQLEQLDNLNLLLDKIKTPLPVLLKLSPDMADSAYTDIAQLALERKLAGIIATNTTINHKLGKGGLSGAPLRARAEFITHLLYQTLGDRLPIIGVGGVCSGRDAYERIRAGARLIQVWTALIDSGLGLIEKINTELVAHLEQDGFTHITQAIGTREPKGEK